MTEYSRKQCKPLPRLPLRGQIDLTYRCNNKCRHCWICLPERGASAENELTFEEIKRIVTEARQSGCKNWSLSGGEPMLRPDFCDIFDYITNKVVHYTLNTNATLITPRIAQLMRREGNKMVAVYGATAETHDHITRTPGSYEAALRGCAYLQEAGASFTVQIVPLKDNFHQYQEMIDLAQSLSSSWRVGASWLYCSGTGEETRNHQLKQQRLTADQVLDIAQPDVSFDEWFSEKSSCSTGTSPGETSFLLERCIQQSRFFHVNPSGQMSFCTFLVDPNFRYDLRGGSFQEGWEHFIPSLKGYVQADRVYQDNCGPCELRSDCRWCPAYSYLEHGTYTQKIEYLCSLAEAQQSYKQKWKSLHRRFFQTGGVTIQVESELPFRDTTLHPKFKHFEVSGPGPDTISIRHHFALPDLRQRDLGQEIYRRSPWAVYRKDSVWIYVGISATEGDKNLHHVALFNHDHTRGSIYNKNPEQFQNGNIVSLTLFPTDQILIGRVLADREACYIHSSAVILNGYGLLFVGHSDAGKSTITTLLQDHVEILCDDRNILRRWPDGYRVHGTWSHGDIPQVSSASAPVKGIMFLEQASENRLVPLTNSQEIVHRLLACLIKPLETADWWKKMLVLVEKIAREVPCFILKFDKSGQIVPLLQDFTNK